MAEVSDTKICRVSDHLDRVRILLDQLIDHFENDVGTPPDLLAALRVLHWQASEAQNWILENAHQAARRMAVRSVKKKDR